MLKLKKLSEDLQLTGQVCKITSGLLPVPEAAVQIPTLWKPWESKPSPALSRWGTWPQQQITAKAILVNLSSAEATSARTLQTAGSKYADRGWGHSAETEQGNPLDCKSGKTFNPKNPIPTVKHGRGSFMLAFYQWSRKPNGSKSIRIGSIVQRSAVTDGPENHLTKTSICCSDLLTVENLWEEFQVWGNLKEVELRAKDDQTKVPVWKSKQLVVKSSKNQ